MKKEDFLLRAFEVHGDKYDYSLVPDEFKSNDKIEIICKSHGVFTQTTGNHISNKRGCPKCGFEHVAGIRSNRAKAKFFKQAPIVHKNKYDYSKSIYVSSDHLIEIVCPIHGSFFQVPYSHLNGQGCRECGLESSGKKQTLSLEEFVEKATKVHGDLYDYSKVEYIRSQIHVLVGCKVEGHGYWKVKPANHFNGTGCPKCAPMKLSERFSFTTEQFIQKAKEIHKDTICFDKVVYKNSDSMVILSCKEHGEFSSKARHVLLGVGCKKCSFKRNADNRSKGQEYYIPLFQEIHNSKYDYSKTAFSNSKEPFIVVCPEHGEFTSTASNHLKGKGCRKCAAENVSKTRSLPLTTVLERIENTYGNLYEYPKITNEWVNSCSKITIVCSQHGEFKQILYDHLKSETGCPKCNGHLSPNEPCWFYIHKVGNGFLKVGITKNMESRLGNQRAGSSLPIENVFKSLISTRYLAYELERNILRSYEFNILPRHLFLDGASETTYFSNYERILEDVMNFINSHS